MVMEELIDCIELLKKRIQSHGNTLRQNETRTRVALIDPLLHSLGWDVSNPEFVTTEYDTKHGKADYALLNKMGKPIVVIEAKKLNEGLDKHQMQMVNYANASGINYAGLTDGNHWEMYDVFKRQALDEKRMVDIYISDTPAHECALRLLMLWRPNVLSSEPTEAVKPVMLEAEDKPKKLIVPVMSNPSPEISPSRSFHGWISLNNYVITRKDRRACPPKAIKFWDGNKQEIKHWYQILTKVVEKLYESRRITASDLPIKSTEKRAIVFDNPELRSGVRYAELDCNLYVYINLSADGLVKQTIWLLRTLNVDPATVYLRDN